MTTLRDTIAQIIGDDHEKLDELTKAVQSWRPVRTTKKFRFNETLEEAVKAKQPKQVMALLKAAETMEEFTLDELAETAVAMGELNTKQQPGRIAHYYKGRLIEIGMVEAS